MTYTPNALDATRPTLADDAGQLPAELREIKTRLIADKATGEANAASIAAETAARTALDADVDVRITETMQGVPGKTKLVDAALTADLRNYILGERALRRIHTAWPHKPTATPTSATDAKNRYVEFKAVSLASNREGRSAWQRPKAWISHTSTENFIAMDPFAVIDNDSGIDLTYTVVMFYRGWSDQQIDVRLVNGLTVIETITDIPCNPVGDTAILRSVTFADLVVPNGTSVELSLEGYLWAGGGDDIAYLEEVIIKPAVV